MCHREGETRGDPEVLGGIASLLFSLTGLPRRCAPRSDGLKVYLRLIRHCFLPIFFISLPSNAIQVKYDNTY